MLPYSMDLGFESDELLQYFTRFNAHISTLKTFFITFIDTYG